MEVDVLIYINTLKNFFDKDKQAYQDMFGTLTIDKDIFFDKVSELAKKNYKEKGEATLSTDQIYEVVDDLLDKNLSKSQKETKLPPSFKKILKDFPPFSLN
jgi:hypothetical protein|tara:strand:- start:542 stop:844 length:303 start_codon:yes stop_codon:yes gene_type:complete